MSGSARTASKRAPETRSEIIDWLRDEGFVVEPVKRTLRSDALTLIEPAKHQQIRKLMRPRRFS
jgi:hypothetical protein